jgi:hypothetical protein
MAIMAMKRRLLEGTRAWPMTREKAKGCTEPVSEKKSGSTLKFIIILFVAVLISAAIGVFGAIKRSMMRNLPRRKEEHKAKEGAEGQGKVVRRFPKRLPVCV